MHDFGVVPPGAVVGWDFPLRNNTDFVWHIARVQLTCRCTAPSVSSPTIRPGEQQTVRVELDCGDEVADIIKTATVEFKEPKAPRTSLQIKASVRAPMTPSARELSFGGLSPGDRPEQAITLSNYSDSDWRSLRVESCPSWAEATVDSHTRHTKPNRKQRKRGSGPNTDATPTDRATAAPSLQARSPRQVWRAAVELATDNLAPGYHQAPVVIRSDTGDTCRFHITAHVVPPVRVVPEELVFGPARPGESSVRIARVMVRRGLGAADVVPRVADGPVTVAVRRISGTAWEVKATLIVPSPSDGSQVAGQIDLSFPGTRLADAVLPYLLFASSDPR